MIPIPLRLTPFQARVFADPHRFAVTNTGRQIGKTTLCAALTWRAMAEGRQQVLYLAPTYGQAKRLLWRPFVHWVYAVLPQIVSRKDEALMTLEWINGSTLRCAGVDAVDTAVRGSSAINVLLLDEYAFHRPEVWSTVQPVLGRSQGRAYFFSTPRGYNHFRDFYLRGEDPAYALWSAHTCTTLQGGLLPPEEIAEARRTMPQNMFRQEYEASFETLGHRVYDPFDLHTHVSKDIGDYGDDLLVGMDFNKTPMTAVVAQRVDDELHVIDEVYEVGSDTAKVAGLLNIRYPGRKIVIYPDASGRASSTNSMGRSDFTILTDAGFRIMAADHNPYIVDRVNAVNRLLLAADGKVRLFVAARKCQNLIKSLLGLTYTPKGEPEKNDLEHITSALGYLVHGLFPISSRAAVQEFHP